MKLTKKLADKAINFWFGGGCPICSGDRTLTCGGSIFNQISKRYIECNICGSKFKASFGVVLPKYKLIGGSSEYLGRELELGDWKKIRTDNLHEADVVKNVTQDSIETENSEQETKKPSKAEDKVICCLGIVIAIGAIFALASERPGIALACWFMLCGVVYWIVIGLIRGTQWLKRNF